ncbi:hypothetical protein GCM10010094_57110 [Streptomyces flaveus]|uniref:Uncharacterized protein n=1 Tax=Streptomyces flaveus TaxID=66370 RepID=A0A917R4E8_9ACTN|nr:hypothetical protein GCM10010094_57110 [Streptomyces flaveus]
MRYDLPHTLQVFVMQPVLEIRVPEDFALWPIVGAEPHGFLPLSGALGPGEVGTAVMSIAACNDAVPEAADQAPRPASSLGAFLHGLLALDDLFVSGGLRVTDTSTGVTLVPGCCNGLEERGDWLDVLDGGGWASFGHDPSSLAERRGDTVRLTVDAERDDSPVIELPTVELRRLLAGAERTWPASSASPPPGRSGVFRSVRPRSRPRSHVRWPCPPELS